MISNPCGTGRFGCWGTRSENRVDFSSRLGLIFHIKENRVFCISEKLVC